MIGALLVSDLNVAQVLFKLDVDHLFGDCSCELVRFNVHFDFSLLVSPRELRDFFRLNYRSRCLGCRSLILRVGLDQHRIATIDLTIFFEVLGALS